VQLIRDLKMNSFAKGLKAGCTAFQCRL